MKTMENREMENGHHSIHSHNHGPHPQTEEKISSTSLALSATLHCLLGCGIGEVVGTIIGIGLGLGNTSTLIIGVTLGFIFGFVLGMRPLLKAKFTYNQAFKQVLIAEGASIVAMETAEVLVEVYTPGVMSAGLFDALFWIGMLLALGAGFIAAFPINYYLVRRGVRHQHE